MEVKSDVVIDLSGNAVAGATVGLYTMAGAIAPMFSANGTPINNLTTDAQGDFTYAAPDGKYELRIAVGGVLYKTRQVTHYDPDNNKSTVNVRNLGAKGDGVTDDTAAIQAAINSLSPNGGVIYFPVGIYLVGNIQINGKSNVHLRGVGYGGSWTSSTLGSMLKAINSDTDIIQFSNYAYNCSVSGLHIKGGKRGIHFSQCLGWHISEVNLRECQVGLEAFGNGVGVLRDSMVRDCTTTGVNLTQSSGDTLIIGSDIGGNRLNIHGCTGSLKIIGNSIFSAKNSGAGVGIWIDATAVSADDVIRYVVIHGNLIANNDMQIKITGTSLADRDVQDVHIHHNHIHQADDGGEGFDSSFAYGQGILIQNAKRVHIDHNNMIGLRDYAIKAVNCLEGVFTDHNHIRNGNAAGVIFDLVQWGRVDSNEFASNVGTAIQMTCTTEGNYTQNCRIGANSFQSNGAVYTEDANTRANFVYDNLGGSLGSYVLGATTPLTQVRHVSQGGNQESIKNQSVYVDGAAWNGSLLKLGANQLWVDGTGRLRIKNGAPTSDTDGTIVGTQA